MPWGVNTEFTADKALKVEIQEDQESVDRTDSGTETTEDYDIDEVISDLE
ncbi:hypothetical protein [Halorubrum persicum]|nr:hypothetical protein [Halorubrum persicum]